MPDFGSTFKVRYLNGTDRQQELFTEALEDCTFRWEKYAMIVAVQWVSDPIEAVHFEAAGTVTHERITVPFPLPSFEGETYAFPTFAGEVNFTYANWPYAQVRFATISIYTGLDDVENKQYVSDEFYKEVCIHEMAHAIAGLFTDVEIGEMCSALGLKTTAEWSEPSGTRDDWEKQGQEAYAEIFKDLFLPSNKREYDNRTEVPLPEAGLQPFLNVLDKFFAYQTTTQGYSFGGSVDFPFGAGPDPEEPLPYSASHLLTGVHGTAATREEMFGTVFAAADLRFTPSEDDLIPSRYFEPGNPWGDYSDTDFKVTITVGEEAEVMPSVPGLIPHEFTPVEPGPVQWGAEIVGTAGPTAILPSPQIKVGDTNITKWLPRSARITYRRSDKLKLIRPPWPYEKPGIDAEPGPPGTVRRSRP